MEERMLAAIKKEKRFTITNTEVVPVFSGDSKYSVVLCVKVYLHGNHIATVSKYDKTIDLHTCGWDTVTTTSRMNAILADEGVTSENRICAQAIRDAAVKKVTAIREEVAILLDAIERYDYYDKLVSDLRSEIGERIAEINPLFRAKELTLFATIDQLNKGRKAIVDKVCGQ